MLFYIAFSYGALPLVVDGRYLGTYRSNQTQSQLATAESLYVYVCCICTYHCSKERSILTFILLRCTRLGFMRFDVWAVTSTFKASTMYPVCFLEQPWVLSTTHTSYYTSTHPHNVILSCRPGFYRMFRRSTHCLHCPRRVGKHRSEVWRQHAWRGSTLKICAL